MNITEIPFAFQSKLRLAVIASLISGPKSFSLLQRLTEATAGNLGKQLELLENEGYVKSKKEFLNKRPNTTYFLSDHGRERFLAYVEMLNELVTKAEEK